MTHISTEKKPSASRRLIFRQYPAVNLNLAFFVCLTVALVVVYLALKGR